MEMSGNQRSLNPAANTRRMYLALGLLLVLGVSSWFTLDGNYRKLTFVFLGFFAARVLLDRLRSR